MGWKEVKEYSRMMARREVSPYLRSLHQVRLLTSLATFETFIDLVGLADGFDIDTISRLLNLSSHPLLRLFPLDSNLHSRILLPRRSLRPPSIRNRLFISSSRRLRLARKASSRIIEN
jgi:hypothetical protein